MENKDVTFWNRKKHKFFKKTLMPDFKIILISLGLLMTSTFLIQDFSDSTDQQINKPLADLVINHENLYSKNKNNDFYLKDSFARVSFIDKNHTQVYLDQNAFKIHSLFDQDKSDEQSKYLIPLPAFLFKDKRIEKVMIDNVDMKTIENESYNDNLKKFFNKKVIVLDIFFK